MMRGDVVCYRGIVSNYGHVQHMPVVVISVGAKRVRVETLDLKRNRRVNVNPLNLHELGGTAHCGNADTSPFLATVERIKQEAVATLAIRRSSSGEKT